MMKMSPLMLGATLVVLCTATSKAEDDKFRPLFNGEDLSGWVRVNTPADTWSVKDGMLICTGKPIGELRTDRMYQNFILELEWRHMKPGGNAGVFVWADDITSRGVPFHRGVEVQVLENAYGNTRSHTTHGDIFPIHGAKMVPINGRGGSRAFPTENRSKPSPEWNHYRIHCQDGEISLAVNGKVVTRGREASPRKGYICLESEGGIVHYRNIRIQELPGEVEAKHVAIADRGYTSIYSGLDLRGWKADKFGKWQSKDWVLSYDGAEHASTLTADVKQLPKTPGWGFVVDIRPKSTTQQAAILVNGAIVPLVVDGQAEEGLEKAGRWSRMEGVVQSGQLKVVVNGKPWKEVATTGSTSLALVAQGQVDFANIYVNEQKQQ